MPVSFRIESLAPLTLAGERVIADQPVGYPCRVCLTDAAVGDALVLGPHRVGTGVYATTGPIFVHADGCARFSGDGIPEAIARRQLAVRAHDADGRLRGGEVIDGEALAELAGRWLADPTIAELRVFHARAGCYACRVVRARGLS